MPTPARQPVPRSARWTGRGFPCRPCRAQLVTAPLALASPPASAATSVDNTVDHVDLHPGDGVCATATGPCPLRAAVQAANALRGAESILLSDGGRILSYGEDTAAEGDLDLTDDRDIKGESSATLDAWVGFAWYTDWRVPNVNELLRLFGYGTFTPTVSPASNTACAPGCSVLTFRCVAAAYY